MFRPIILLSALFWVAGCASQGANNQSIADINTSLALIDTRTSIFDAIEQADEDAFKQALLSGASLNASLGGLTPLRSALINRQSRFASILLRLGAIPDWNLEKGNASALMLASAIGANKVVKQLILREGELNYTDRLGHNALSKAALAGHLTTVNVLINAGIDVNPMPEGQSLLMRLVEQNNMLIVRPLIDAGADLNFIDQYGNTALSVARENQFHELDLMLVHAGARL